MFYVLCFMLLIFFNLKNMHILSIIFFPLEFFCPAKNHKILMLSLPPLSSTSGLISPSPSPSEPSSAPLSLSSLTSSSSSLPLFSAGMFLTGCRYVPWNQSRRGQFHCSEKCSPRQPGRCRKFLARMVICARLENGFAAPKIHFIQLQKEDFTNFSF